jgi:hypothetical protein
MLVLNIQLNIKGTQFFCCARHLTWSARLWRKCDAHYKQRRLCCAYASTSRDGLHYDIMWSVETLCVTLCHLLRLRCIFQGLRRITPGFVQYTSPTSSNNNNKVIRDSSVGIATRYGLDSRGIQSRWGRDFLHPSRPALGPTQPPIQWVPGLSRGKVAGTWPHTPSTAEVKERVGLYLYPPVIIIITCLTALHVAGWKSQ